jgi:hypothetical protein
MQKKIIDFILNKFFRKGGSWKTREYFDEVWKLRIKQMAENIPVGSSVMDLGCGKEWLKEFLPSQCTYNGSDYTPRSPSTIVCDFNKFEFPSLQVDVTFVSGCLEYVINYEWFINQISVSTANRCILSYCAIEYFPDTKKRVERNWVNNLTGIEIIELFQKNNFVLLNQTLTETNNLILIFERVKSSNN